jgi:hypothetical protein
MWCGLGEENEMNGFKAMIDEFDWLYALVVYILAACLTVIIVLIPVLYVVDFTSLALFDYLLWRAMRWASLVAIFSVLMLSTTPFWRRGKTLFRGHYYCPTERKRGFLWKRYKDGEG